MDLTERHGRTVRASSHMTSLDLTERHRDSRAVRTVRASGHTGPINVNTRRLEPCVTRTPAGRHTEFGSEPRIGRPGFESPAGH
jgi:hypothetical protein